jgi:hypothetical protein
MLRGLVALLIALVVPTEARTEDPRPVQRIKTEKGTFAVPGTAFIDGRDLEASPPLTVMSVSVWESTRRLSRLCSLPHGASVSLAQVERVQAEERYYFRVVTKACEGWVPEVFLSIRRQRVVGTPQ